MLNLLNITCVFKIWFCKYEGFLARNWDVYRVLEAFTEKKFLKQFIRDD